MVMESRKYCLRHDLHSSPLRRSQSANGSQYARSVSSFCLMCRCLPMPIRQGRPELWEEQVRGNAIERVIAAICMSRGINLLACGSYEIAYLPRPKSNPQAVARWHGARQDLFRGDNGKEPLSCNRQFQGRRTIAVTCKAVPRTWKSSWSCWSFWRW